ncbi:CD5 antigen-like [Microtus ochrogaster]|uniref:CD5 antigen-like n=1 Tax=Microtus ochrogaster TaxID=79684 RepID=A0A8J6G7Y1_MICOH|nr:CD5 antigen-like [Microtus ochrogaster]
MEDTLSQCEQNEDVYNCPHSEDAGARCVNPDSDVRLVDGPGRCQGRVELLHQEQWSTVCKAGWNLRAAKVVCRQLGCGRALLTHRCCNKMTQGQGPIWMRQVSCFGQEVNLQDCPLRPLENNCTHDEDTWVECEDPFQLRLVGGDNPCAGRLEVLHKGTWGSVCDDSWGEEEDQVVCKQLGCGKPLSLSFKAQKSYRPGAGHIWLDDVVCSGKEKSLESCQHRLWGYHDCTHKEDVAVMCSVSNAAEFISLMKTTDVHKEKMQVFHTQGSTIKIEEKEKMEKEEEEKENQEEEEKEEEEKKEENNNNRRRKT